MRAKRAIFWKIGIFRAFWVWKTGIFIKNFPFSRSKGGIPHDFCWRGDVPLFLNQGRSVRYTGGGQAPLADFGPGGPPPPPSLARRKNERGDPFLMKNWWKTLPKFKIFDASRHFQKGPPLSFSIFETKNFSKFLTKGSPLISKNFWKVAPPPWPISYATPLSSIHELPLALTDTDTDHWTLNSESERFQAMHNITECGRWWSYSINICFVVINLG